MEYGAPNIKDKDEQVNIFCASSNEVRTCMASGGTAGCGLILHARKQRGNPQGFRVMMSKFLPSPSKDTEVHTYLQSKTSETRCRPSSTGMNDIGIMLDNLCIVISPREKLHLKFGSQRPDWSWRTLIANSVPSGLPIDVTV